MKNREYSTKNIDRILKQVNGLVANKRNSIISATYQQNNLKLPIQHSTFYIEASIGIEDIYERDVKNNLRVNGQDVDDDYIPDEEVEDMLIDMLRDVKKEIEPIVEKFNKNLQIYEIGIDNEQVVLWIFADEKIRWSVDVPDDEAGRNREIDRLKRHEQKMIQRFFNKMVKQYGFEINP